MPFTPFDILSAEATSRAVDDARAGILRDNLRRARLWDAFKENRLNLGQARRAIRLIVDDLRDDLRPITETLVRGGSLNRWFSRMVRALVPANIAASLAILGTPEPAPADIDSIRSQVNKQGGFLAGFYQKIRVGAELLGPKTVAHAEMFAGSPWLSAEEVRREKMARDGYSEERRILGADDGKNCLTCPEQAGLGWVPIGTLLPIGQSECRSNCRCHFVFR
jgi:hypothetical protein